MNKLIKHILLLSFVCLPIKPVLAYKPHIINLSKGMYQADNKNWSIGQDEKGVMYFGNDIGLLEFDGIEWKLNKTPNSPIARSVAVQLYKTIFTGSYEEFGRWDRDISGKLVYTSLSDQLDKALFKNDDFWKIWIADDHVYFQSFSSIYVYDYKTVKHIPFDGGFLFLSKVRDELLVQQMYGSLYRLKGSALTKIEGSEIFNNTEVRVILPYSTNEYLIGTSTKGIYIYDGATFKEWNISLSKTLSSAELNCGILSSKGVYFFGTILDGFYQVDNTGKILDHISTESMLQNNTVLSLYEDNIGNIWAALDKGISYIQYIENMSCFADKGGKTGAVYGGALWNDKLFIGTNQGVFYISTDDLKKPGALANTKLINGTQGQVWALKVLDGKLYCCHNKGLKMIQSNLSVVDMFNLNTGVYNVSEIKYKDKDLLFLSTYKSLKIADPATNKIYDPRQISEPIINADVDHIGNVWLEHFNRGIYRCKLNDDLSGFQTFSYYGGNSKGDLPYKMKMFKVGGRIVLLGNNKFYTYDDISNKIVSNTVLDECFKNVKNLKQVIHIRHNEFWALTDASVYKFSYDGYEASIKESYNLDINLSLVNAYENISILNDSLSLVCLDNGFLIYKKEPGSKLHPQNKLSLPYLESLGTTNTRGDYEYKDLSKATKISYNYNAVTFSFSAENAFASNFSFQYMLQGVDNGWSTPQKVNHASYARLPEGKYIFMVRTVDNLGHYSDSVSYEFEILPPWYQTFWAYLLYIVLIIFTMYLIWMLILRRYRNLHLQKIRARETRRLKMLTGELQQAVEQKNAELLTQTSFIIQKNELILKIKDIIDDFYSKNRSNVLIPLLQKINALLNTNMNTEDDWKTFLLKFEEKHTGFFKKMKILYPQLTNSDLRLCACLKLNLETKEIASLMNLSVRAVENSRYRLRKKLNILPSQNLNEFFLNLN
jgi:hypothetical protein